MMLTSISWTVYPYWTVRWNEWYSREMQRFYPVTFVFQQIDAGGILSGRLECRVHLDTLVVHTMQATNSSFTRYSMPLLSIWPTTRVSSA